VDAGAAVGGGGHVHVGAPELSFVRQHYTPRELGRLGACTQ
jgi:hypothetical protein